jgi:uroporphyrinogen-III decarboxylase
MEERTAAYPGVRLRKMLKGDSKGVMLAFWDTAPFLNDFAGVGLREYYEDAALKMRVQTSFQEQFPEAVLLPGVWADYGALCEPSAFGCPIVWPESGMPTALPVLRSLSEVQTLKVPDPATDGLMPKALAEYRYFWEQLKPEAIERYGYLDGVAASFGPVELAAVLLGHANFFLSLRREPSKLHALLEITTEAVLRWLRAHEAVNGPLKQIALADHVPGQIRPEDFEEFFLPYTNRVPEAFPAATVLYHNEYPIPYLPLLSKLKASLFHFGGSIRNARQALGGTMLLMGNLDPVGLLLRGTPEEVAAKAAECLAEAGSDESFLLSSAGGLAPGTPVPNLRAMAEALQQWEQRSLPALGGGARRPDA